MRALFLLLVAANLAFFAWLFYVSPPDSGRDPRPMTQQLEPHKLRILPQEADATRAAQAPKAAASPAACLEWGGFAASDAPRAGQALAALALGERLGQRKAEDSAGAQPKVWFQVRGVDAALQGRLKDIAAGFAGTELKDCP